MTETKNSLSAPSVEPVNLNAPPPLPKFRCHKVVQAARIVNFQVFHGRTTMDLILDAGDGRDQFVHSVTDSWLKRHQPEVGGYLVRYEDGYESYSPPKAFEEGYTKMQEVSPPAGARRITEHQVNPANDKLVIEVTDEPGSGGANHRYDITGFDTDSNPSADRPDGYKSSFSRLPVIFQNGPIAESGVNGVTNEALLAIVIDRMRSFQSGPFACRENALALTKLEEAQHWLHHRTRARMARGVEGTHQK